MRALTHSMFALLWCQEKPSGVYKMQETAWAAGAPPGPRWESLQRSPRPPSWWGAGLPAPYPRTSPPVSAFQASPVPTPKFLGNVKKHAKRMRSLTHNMFALLWCQEKPSGVYKMQETAWVVGAPPGPRWGSLQRSPRPPSRLGGGWLPPPQEPNPRFRPFRPHLSPPPNFQPPPELKSWQRPWEGIGKGGIGPPTFWLLPPSMHIVLHCDNLLG